MNWQEHIISDPKICHGKLCIKGTRIMVTIVLDNLAEGLTPEAIISAYPTLTTDDVHAVLIYASVLAKEEELIPLLAV